MDKILMIGADVHEKSIVTKFAVNREQPQVRSFANRRKAWPGLAAFFKEQAHAGGAQRIVFAYEASGFGTGLYDFLAAQGFEVYLLAPTKLKRSEKDRRCKSDLADAELILATLRGHVLGGNELPTASVPDAELRDDRRMIRTRLDAAVKAAAIKAQVHGLLKDASVEKPEGLGSNWAKLHRAWLAGLCAPGGLRLPGTRAALQSLLRQLAFYEEEIARLNEAVQDLAAKPRYAQAAYALDDLTGVRVLTALVFLTEMGDVLRFRNRREVGAFMGLAPTSHESGNATDRKGHITRQGPARLRRVLCQAVWSRIRCDAKTKVFYQGIVSRNPKKKMIGVVACMRKLGIEMWHVAVAAQRAA